MIFSIQRYVEDYAAQRNLNDVDQYAIRLANLYDSERADYHSDVDFLRRMRRLRTSFFIGNGLDRASFERQLLSRLDRKFKKKINPSSSFPGGVSAERKQLSNRPRSISNMLQQFKRSVQGRGVDAFWESRMANKLKPTPESIGQALIAQFIAGVLNGKGVMFREVGSGIGFVDIVVMLSTTPHLIELKILRGKMTGASQIQTYMRTEDRRTGWLILFDARPDNSREGEIPESLDVPEGRIKIVVVDINPVPPSKK